MERQREREGGRGRCGGWRRAEGRWGDGTKTKVDGRQGLSPLVPPIPVVMSAAVVAAFAAAVELVLLMIVRVLMVPAGMPLTSGVAAVARVVAAAACCSMGIAWARLMPLLLLVMLLLVEVEVAPAGWPDPVLGRRVPRL